MSIASEIIRLQTAKADIKTAIEAKGVTVPANATIDDYDTYVSQIQTGGGGNNKFAELVDRSITTLTAADLTGVTTIGQYAFRGCTSLISVDLVNTSVTTLNTTAFANCTSLTSIDLTNIRTMSTGVFNGCSSLTSIVWSSYISVIPQNCFEATGFISLNIPSNINTIDNYGFKDVKTLTSVTLPEGLQRIGSSGFTGCTSLATINYTGTMAQWASVTKGVSWNRNVPATVVHCSDGDVTL